MISSARPRVSESQLTSTSPSEGRAPGGGGRPTRAPPPWLGAARGDHVDAQFAARRLDRLVHLTGRNPEPLGEDLEMVDQGFHRLVDARPGRRGHLAILGPVVAWRHGPGRLLDDPQRLANLLE